MIIPSIDLMDGHAVQLIGGKEKALDAGDPIAIAEKYSVAGELAVIDLDAALGRGSNEEVIKKLLSVAPCRVGGGIRDIRTAVKWLDAGANKIILGTKAIPEILSQLPRDWLIAALDLSHGEVVVEGWQTGTGHGLLEKMAELQPYVAGFLVTFVELEGRLGGTNLSEAEKFVEAAGPARLTIAGGVTTVADIATLDQFGADAQVGMALYTDKMRLADAIVAPLVSDRADGLWPTVVCDQGGTALGLTWSSAESVRKAVDLGRGVYHSRKRGIWVKGETSGATQQLLRIDLDCDRDTLRFVVRQQGVGFCHQNSYTCWGEESGLSSLFKVLESRRLSAPLGSYTRRLFDDPQLLHAKLREEVGELCQAKSTGNILGEAADVLYFTLCKIASADIELSDVEEELKRRALKVTRRAGNAKS